MGKVRLGVGALMLGVAFATPAWGAAQEEAEAHAEASVTIVANQVAVSQRDATLMIELDDGRSLEIEFKDGAIEVDGDVVGQFTRNDALDSAWRGLLGSAVGVANGPLATLLSAWEPGSIEGNQAETATLLDTTLEEFLGSTEVTTADADDAVSVNVEQDGDDQRVRVGISITDLLGSRDLLGLLGELGDLDLDLDQLTVSMGEDLVVRSDERIEGDVLVVGGDLDVRGEIDGNVVVADGRVRLFENGTIHGDLSLAEATFSDYGGELEGRRNRIRASRSDEFARLRDELREELRVEIRDELESELHSNYDWMPRRGIFNPFRHFWAGLMGLFQNVLTFGILAGVGAILLYFNHERMASVVETARSAPARSAVVGLAGGFLFFPVWILGIVVLTISIIGIPALLLWVPLFPLAAGFGALFGMFAVASLLGEWAQSRKFRLLEWADDPNAFYRMVSGLLVLTSLFAGANVLRMGGPLLGFFHGVLAFLACMVSVGVVLTGFGAVLLTWSNRRTARYGTEYEADWSWRDWTPKARRAAKAAAATEAADAAADVQDADIVDEASDIVDDAMDAAAEAVDTVADVLDDAVGAVKEALDDLTDTVEDVAADASAEADEAEAPEDDEPKAPEA